MIALRYNDVVVPILILDRGLNLVRLPDRSHHFGLAISAHNGLFTALCQYAPALFLIDNAGVGFAGLKIGLVAARNPVTQILAAILDARVSADNSIGQPEFEVFNCTHSPKQERVSLGWILGCRLASDQSVPYRPEFGIAFPAGEIRTVKQALESGRVFSRRTAEVERQP